MSIKIAGAILILISSAAIGFIISAYRRYEIHLLKDLLFSINYIKCELSYKCTALPDLFTNAANITGGTISKLLSDIALGLERKIASDSEKVVLTILKDYPDIPESIKYTIIDFSKTLGNFGLEGQLEELSVLQSHCAQLLDRKAKDREKYVRCYETLGICCGAALVILLI